MHRMIPFILLAFFLHCAAFCPAQEEGNGKEDLSSVLNITQKQPIEIRKLPKGRIDDLRKEADYWYVNLEPEKKKIRKEDAAVDQNGSLLEQAWFLDLLWIIILCSFIAVVIWYLASSNIRLFRKESPRVVEEEVTTEENDDIFTIHYEREIGKAVAEKNYRLAVRLWYLRTLRELSDRKIIDYRHERTNVDYVHSLMGGRYYQPFFRLTRNFEYTWYGQFPLSAEAYEKLRKDFSDFKNSLAA